MQSTSISIEFAQAKQLLDSSEYSAALHLIEEIRASRGLDSCSVSDKSRLLYLQSRALYNLGRFKAALITIKAALRLSRKIFDDDLYASQKLTFALISTALGRHAIACEAYLESYAFRKRAGKKSALYGPLLNLGLLKILSGELNLAKENCLKALELAKLHNSESEVNLTRQAYLLSLWLRGEFQDISTELRNWNISDKNDPNWWRIQSINARCQMDRLEFEGCESLLNQALRFYRKKQMPRDVAVCLEYLGLNEYFAGNYKKARKYYDQVLAMPEPTASAVAQTLRMLTDVEVAEGNWDKAKETAAKAEAAITKISEKIELGALWRAYGHIHAHEKKYEEAQYSFRRSIELLRQLGARYELAMSHFDAGRSDAFTPTERMEQLVAARSLFVEMEVPKRVAQVDEAIRQLKAEGNSPTGLATGRDSQNSGHSRGGGKKSAPTIIASSKAMKDIVALADRIKDTNLTLLITGETGTGKDLLAEYIHKTSVRAHKPFIAINCAAIPEPLLESELFGYKKGTYTGAHRDRVGLIEAAEGGTFYFDEIGEATTAIQSKLLRVIETRSVRRLGDNRDIIVNVRFICATNRDMSALVANGRFRQDLYFRISEMPIELPPLQERREDIGSLLTHFLKVENVSLSVKQHDRLVASLNGYQWPGNVRQLRTLVKKAVATASNGDLLPALEFLLTDLNRHTIDPNSAADLRKLLSQHDGNISSAARDMGIPASTYRYRLNNGD